MTNQTAQKTKRSIVMSFLLFIVLLCICIFTLLFFLIQKPVFVNALAKIFRNQIGFNISIGDISISPDFNAEMRDIRIMPSDDEGIALFVSYANIQSGFTNLFQGEIHKAVLKEPSLSVILEKKDTKFDLSFLKKLPPVQLLEIDKGDIQLLLGQDGQSIRLSEINLILKDFSPLKGGAIKFKFKINVKSKHTDSEGGAGHGEGDFSFTRLSPEPLGKGTIKLSMNMADFDALQIQNLSLNMAVNMKPDEFTMSSEKPFTGSLTYKTKDRDIVLRDMQLMPFANYNAKTGKLFAGLKNSSIGNLGAFDLTINSLIKQDYPWKASINAQSVDIQKTSEIFKAFLPSPYNTWTFQGIGSAEIKMEGDYKDNKLSGNGKIMLQFKEGGFSSPDSEKAALGVGGKIIMNIQIPAQAEKGKFDLSSEISLGEFLWGKYYKDFSGEKAVFLSKGGFQNTLFDSVDFSGSLNLADGGDYSYSGFIDSHGWVLHLNSEDIYFQKFFSFFFREYAKQNIPSLSGILLKGSSRFDIDIRGKGSEIAANGIFKINEGYFSIQDKLSGKINLTLPFDFFYPQHDNSVLPGNDVKTGNLHIETLDTAYAKIKDLDIPLIFTKNTILISGGALTPFLGIPLKLTYFRGERLLSPDRSFSLGVIINGMEIGSYIEKASGTNIPARFEADLADISYQNEALNIKGRAVIGIFEGRVDIDNIHGRKLFSPSRVIGGDIAFEGINLNALTGYIELGRMSGIIKGSLKGLELEYGQPSRFILDVESDKAKGVSQSVSVDAIESFSILGSGSPGIGTILKRGLNRFFKEYPYSKMGIMCILENDVFTLRGKIHEGGKEYLIRKAFLRGIDVVNQNPDNNISFRDMKERINRIFEKRQVGQDKST